MDADGLTLLLGEMETDEEGLSEADGLTDKLAELLGEALAEGEGDELGEAEELGLTEADGEELTLAEGEVEAEGERDTLKLCIDISQVSLVFPVTFLNSSIAPKTFPAGWGPYLTIDGRGRITPSWVSITLPELFKPSKGVRVSSYAVTTPDKKSLTDFLRTLASGAFVLGGVIMR